MNTEDLNNREEELKDAPLLRSLQNGKGFDAPDGYFDSLTSSIQDKINKPAPSGVFNLRPIFTTLSLGGLAILLFILLQKNTDPTVPTAPQISETEITSDDIIASGYYTEIDESLIAESFAEPSISDEAPIPSDSGMEEYLLESSSEEELINAL